MKFIKECIWKIITEWMYKYWSPPALDLPLIAGSRLCSVAWLEQNHPALPSPRNPKSEVAFSTEVNVVQSSSHCTFGDVKDLQRPRTFPWRNTQLPPPLCRAGPCPQSGLCNSRMHVVGKARQRWPTPSRVSWSHSLYVSCHPNCVKLISFLLESSFSLNVWGKSIFFLLL